MDTTFTPEDVAAYEHATWSRCAPGYDEGFAVLTGEAVAPLLEVAAVGKGTRTLDVGTGPGTAAIVARARGANVVGVDFSDAMIAEARRAADDIDYRTASADQLPFDDGQFEAVIANCVLHHLGDPRRALDEANRVLAPGGRVACTIWGEPESLAAFGIFFAAVEQHAGGAELPHGPLFGVTDHPSLTELFENSGFEGVSISKLSTTWRMKSIDSLLKAMGTWAELDTFPETARRAIETTVRDSAAAYANDDGLAIPNPMLLISAVKPG